MKILRVNHGVIAIFIILSSTSPGLAAPTAAPIGRIKSVTGKAFVVRGNARLAAHVGDAVLERDALETEPQSSIGVSMNDNTLLSAGPSSHISLDQYRFDPSTLDGQFFARMRRGSLAVVSGDITRHTPGAMRIQTPRAVLGVRGTEFLVNVTEP